MSITTGAGAPAGHTGFGRGSEAPSTICEAFQWTAAVDPDAVALRTVGGTQTLTWQAHADEVRAVAAGLSALGVRRGDTVALTMANRTEFYPLEVGAQHLGATSFSVYDTSSSEQLAHVLANAGAKVVLCEEQYVGLVQREPGGDELTLTSKLRRKPIAEKYAIEIDALYADSAGVGVHEPAPAH